METCIPDELLTTLHIHQFIFSPASYCKGKSSELVPTELSEL